MDFETYVRDKHVVTDAIVPSIPFDELPVPILIVYEPYEDSQVFTFSNIQDTMNWLGLPRHKGSIVIAHCGGSFDFQMILRYFLSDDVLQMKKVKAPL